METKIVETSDTPKLSLADIAFIVKIIDIASRRGAFAGEELASIGNYRTKIDLWVKSMTSKTAPETAAADDGVAHEKASEKCSEACDCKH